jgi:uncharacterized protein
VVGFGPGNYSAAVTPERSVDALLSALRGRLRAEQRLLVAYSGGVDSALVAAVAAQELGERAVSVTAVSASLPRSERAAARAFAAAHGIAHVEVATDELDRPEYVANGGDRCYHCKSALFDALAPLAALSGARIALGTNVDDLGDHRPGLDAARAHGVRSPLVDAAMDKADVRALAARLGLEVADKPASPCLASRLAYGVEVTPPALRRIDAAEEIVRGLGFDVLRVRDHGDLARIEVPLEDFARAAELRDELHESLAGLGFRFVTLDLGGFRSGSLNATLGPPQIRPVE